VLAGIVPGTTVTFSSVATPVYVDAGLADPVAVSSVLPSVPQVTNELAVLCGITAPVAKSAPLLFVGEHRFVRIAAVVFDSVAVGVPSEQFAAEPKPTKSTSVGSGVGHEPLNAVVLLTSATFPAVALILIEPVASGVGRFVVPPAPTASCTSRYCPGCRVSVGSDVTCHDVPVELAYCTLHPATVTGAAVELNSSTKSFLYVAPEFPPPPYTWEITTDVSVAATAVLLRLKKAEQNASRDAKIRKENRLKFMTGYYRGESRDNSTIV
jgi:hypothetical protein